MRNLVLFVLMVALTGCASDCGYPRTLEGRVVNMGSRLKATDSGAQQKVSLIIEATQSDPKIDEVAGGPSGVVIECLSTRCASIIEGTCHRFACSFESRWREPDVIECKHEKEIKCPDSSGRRD